MKKKIIKKRFTPEEDEILLNIMLQNKSTTASFKEASETLNRTIGSIKSRWYFIIRHPTMQYNKIKDNSSRESVKITKTAKTNNIGKGFIRLLTILKNFFTNK